MVPPELATEMVLRYCFRELRLYPSCFFFFFFEGLSDCSANWSRLSIDCLKIKKITSDPNLNYWLASAGNTDTGGKNGRRFRQNSATFPRFYYFWGGFYPVLVSYITSVDGRLFLKTTSD